VTLDILRKELDVSMALCGKRDIRDVDRDVLWDAQPF
jgi:L-lactate dehydrogenase (cytochrome)